MNYSKSMKKAGFKLKHYRKKNRVAKRQFLFERIELAERAFEHNDKAASIYLVDEARLSFNMSQKSNSNDILSSLRYQYSNLKIRMEYQKIKQSAQNLTS